MTTSKFEQLATRAVEEAILKFLLTEIAVHARLHPYSVEDEIEGETIFEPDSDFEDVLYEVQRKARDIRKTIHLCDRSVDPNLPTHWLRVVSGNGVEFLSDYSASPGIEHAADLLARRLPTLRLTAAL